MEASRSFSSLFYCGFIGVLGCSVNTVVWFGPGKVVVGGHALVFLAESEMQEYTTRAAESTPTTPASTTTTAQLDLGDGTTCRAGFTIVGVCSLILFL